MKYLFLSLVIFVTGCSVNANPGGMTHREQIRADAAIAVAQAEADAQIKVAEAESRAIVAKHSMWAGTLPIALVIVGAVALGALWLNWRWRYELKALELASTSSATERHLSLSKVPTLGQLHRLAERQGYTLEIAGDTAYLVDAQGKRYRQKALTG